MAIHKNMLVIYVLLAFLIGSKVEAASGPQKLFVFGDSYVDTGNHQENVWGPWLPPYGKTFPGKPAGRYSNGRVLTDFVAESLKLPSPVPYRLRDAKPNEQKYGMNFAYGGAGVFDTYPTVPKMSNQIDQFEQILKEGVYSRKDLESALVLVSVAGNDYTAFFSKGGNIQGLFPFIQSLVGQISVNLQRLSSLGAKKIALTAIEPLGCMPSASGILSYSQCDENSNRAAVYHNQLVQGVADQMNKGADTSVVILDMYNAFLSVIQGEDGQGNGKFEELLKPCCLGSNQASLCGMVDGTGNELYELCDNPESYFFWDWVHPTQAGWAAVSPALVSTLHNI